MSPSISTSLLLTQSDARLAKLAGEGHERAFEALVQRHRRQLLAYCRRLLLPDERAEDALQQGLLKAWLALQGGAEVKDVKPWLYRIVHNAALDMLRVSGYDYATLTEALRGADAPDEDLDRRIAVREALAGLASLPAMQREALLRTAVDGHSHGQVAQALGLSEGALRGLVYRARATLRAAATAITPPPALTWALNHRLAGSAPLAARLTELASGGGSVGMGGLLLKGGAVVVTAGALAGGVAVEHRRQPSDRKGQLVGPASPADAAAQQSSPVELSSSRRPVASAGEAPGHGGLRPVHDRPVPLVAPGHRTGARPEPATHALHDLPASNRSEGGSTTVKSSGDGHRGSAANEGEKGSSGAQDPFGSGTSGSGGDGSGASGSASSGSDSGSGSSSSGSAGSDSGSGSTASGSGSDSGSASGSGSGDKSGSGDGGLLEEATMASSDGSQSGDPSAGGSTTGSTTGSTPSSPTGSTPTDGADGGASTGG